MQETAGFPGSKWGDLLLATVRACQFSPPQSWGGVSPILRGQTSCSHRYTGVCRHSDEENKTDDHTYKQILQQRDHDKFTLSFPTIN